MKVQSSEPIKLFFPGNKHTFYLESPEEVVLMLLVSFKPHLETKEITDAIERIRHNIKHEFRWLKL